jgi:hypothetical protein
MSMCNVMNCNNADRLRQIDAPFDSGDYPKSVLVQGDDIYTTWCAGFPCAMRADDWPGATSLYAPGAMFQAELYCADCIPLSYCEYDGNRVDTLSGREAS